MYKIILIMTMEITPLKVYLVKISSTKRYLNFIHNCCYLYQISKVKGATRKFEERNLKVFAPKIKKILCIAIIMRPSVWCYLTQILETFIIARVCPIARRDGDFICAQPYFSVMTSLSRSNDLRYRTAFSFKSL